SRLRDLGKRARLLRSLAVWCGKNPWVALVGAATAFACTPFLDAPGADFSEGETEFTHLKAERPVIDAWFGYSLTWGGDALVVTAPFESYSSDAGGVIERAGAAYLFEPSLGTWNQKRIEL